MKKFIVAAISEIGKVKKVNQDHILVRIGEVDGEEFGIFAIADGLGGLSSGEFASAFTLQKINCWWQKDISFLLRNEEKVMGAVSASLGALIKEVNQEIFMKSIKENIKMGTTLTILFLYKKKYFIIHIGDSRIYSIKKNSINQITVDHSYVGDLVKKRIISQKEAKSHPKRNVLTRCLGISEEIRLDLQMGWITEKENIIFCSDGFYNLLEKEEILVSIKKYKRNPEKILRDLSKLVYQRGAYDNLSVVFVTMEE